MFAFLKKAVFNWLWTVYSQNYAMFYNEPWRAILQGKQREPGAWVHATLKPFCGIHTRSCWLHPPFHILPMPVRAKGRSIFFFCTHLIKEKIRREVGAVRYRSLPPWKVMLFWYTDGKSITHPLGNSKPHSDKLFGHPHLVHSLRRVRLLWTEGQDSFFIPDVDFVKLPQASCVSNRQGYAFHFGILHRYSSACCLKC